jgi:hypothetical protein
MFETIGAGALWICAGLSLSMPRSEGLDGSGTRKGEVLLEIFMVGR